jgi:hypothetical protein
MNSKRQKTIEAIFSSPVNGNLEWRKIESLFLGMGALKDEGQGSAVTFILNDSVPISIGHTRTKKRCATGSKQHGSFWRRQDSNHEYDEIQKLCRSY